MRKYDSPISNHHNKGHYAYKNHQSPITKLTNLADTKITEQSKRNQDVLHDRSNQPYIPQNAVKYSQGSNEKNFNREKQIEEIRKKYYENSDHKDRISSHKYDKYQIYKPRTQNAENIQPRTPHSQQYGREKDSFTYQNQIMKSHQYQNMPAKEYGNKPLQKQKLLSNLQKISEVSNSNYQTINKMNETFSPQRNRIKSSYIIEDRSNKRKTGDYDYRVDSLRKKQPQISLIKQAKSRYEESAQNSANNKSSKYSNNQRSSAQSYRVESRIDNVNLKPFSLEQNKLPLKPSVDCPTIYDNYLPKSYGNPIAETAYKPRNYDHTVYSKPNQRNHTQQKIQGVNKDKQIQQRLYNQRNPKKRVLQFQDSDRIKDIQKRLKQRQTEFKKREEQLKEKLAKTSEKKPEVINQKYNQSASTNQNGSNPKSLQFARTQYKNSGVQKQIERLSSKIKQFQDKKRHLNIITKPHQSTKPSKNIEDTSHMKNPKQYQDARKTLEQYRLDNRAKSSIQIKQDISKTLFKNQQKRNLNNQQERLPNRFQQKLQNPQNNKICEFIQRTKPMYSERTLPFPKSSQKSSFSFQLFKIESQNEQSSANISKVTTTSNSSKNASECKNQFDIQKRTDDGMEYRKKKLQQSDKIQSTQSLKKIVSLMSKQSAFDEQLRNCKIWFHTLRDQNKWRQLKRALRDQSSSSYNELKDGTIAQFHLSEQQNNPFFSVTQQSKFTYQALVAAFLKSKSYWEQNFMRKFDKYALKSEGFCHQKFDLQKRGFINLEDLVRFLNFESGNFYRNRDLYLIYKRFLGEDSNEKSLNVEKMLSMLAY